MAEAERFELSKAF